MKRCFVFCHGFGFDKSFWRNLAPYFAQESCIYLDLGYFGDKSDTMFPIKLNIGIGHSLGLPKLLSLNKKFDYLIGLNSFVNFLGNDLELRDKRKQELQTLKENLELGPTFTLKNFYKRCGAAVELQKIAQINKEVALYDLELLSDTFHIPYNIPILIIGSKNDVIVPEKILRDNFDKHPNVTVQMLDQGMHGLGFLETAAIYKHIMSFIND